MKKAFDEVRSVGLGIDSFHEPQSQLDDLRWPAIAGCAATFTQNSEKLSLPTVDYRPPGDLPDDRN